MQKFTSYFIGLATLALVVNIVFPAIPASVAQVADKATEKVVEVLEAVTETAQAAQGGPTSFRVGIQDDTGNNGGCSNDYREYGWAGYTNPPGMDYGYVTDGNGKDPNCARINMDPGNIALSNGSMYTSDFRIGIALAESENSCSDRRSATSWTPWASQGGGAAYNYASSSIDAADCIWIYYETRVMPNAAIRITDARTAISVRNGGLKFTPWASQGGGWSAWSITSGKDFTSAGIALEVRMNYKYNASYVSTTIPQNPPSNLTKNQAYNNRNIVMQNIPDVGASSAMPWISDSEVSSSTNRGVAHCYEWTPTGASETCTQTTVYTSSKFKLRRIDNNTAAVQTTPGDLSYRRTVVSQWGASQVWEPGQCYEVPGGPGDGPIINYNSPEDNSFENGFGLIKTAQALPPGPGDGGGTVCDPPTPSDPPVYTSYFMSQDQSPDIQLNENATFENITVTGVQDGDYQLQYQMVNTDTNELFGDPNAAGNSNTIARINVRIGSWSLTCDGNATVPVGQVAYFAIGTSGTPTGPVSVTMTSNPIGPSMTNSPLSLDSTNGYSGTASVATAGLTPGLYNMTFSGNGGGTGSTATCPATLTVNGGAAVVPGQANLAIYSAPTLQFTINGGSSATITPNATATLSWTTTATNSGNECVASGNWSGNQPSTPGTPHNLSVGPLATGNYTYNLICAGGVGQYTPMQTVTLTVEGPINPPGNTTVSSTQACGGVTVTWTAPGAPSNPLYYKVYRRVFGTSGIGTLIYTTPNASTLSHFDTTGDVNVSYQYGVTAVYNTGESNPAWSADGATKLPCSASMTGSYKKIVGSGSAVPTFSRCSGSTSGYTLPTGQIFQSGDTVYFEICVRNSGNQDLTSVTVTEVLAQDRNLENVQYVNSENNCASGTGTGPYTIGTMAANAACSILVKATISNPGGPTSSLHYFVNYAQLASTQVTMMVNTLPEPFVIGSGVPTRTETPR